MGALRWFLIQAGDSIILLLLKTLNLMSTSLVLIVGAGLEGGHLTDLAVLLP